MSIKRLIMMILNKIEIDGELIIEFNQKLLVPDFLSNKKRLLADKY